MTHQQAVPVQDSGSREARRVAVASFVGTAIEWYDFFLYGAAAALVFGPQFFPASDPSISQLAALTTFAVGFLARPIGGIVAGHFGDRIGRKRMLVISLLIMGMATVLVGLLPTYAQIGVAAPILLVVLRLAQGVGVGAEWGGAALMAVEHAPPSRRGLYGAAPQLGVPAGAIVANLVLLVASTSTREAFVDWGWRLGFLVSFVLVVFGLVIRRRLTESPLFAEAARHRPARVPLLEVLRDHPLAVLRSVFVTGASTAMGYIILTYILSYGTAEVGYSRNALLVVVILTSVVQLGAIYGLSGMADRYGRRKVIAAGAIAQAVVALLFFLVFDTGVFVLALVACVVAVITVSAQYGPLPALLSDQFPTRIRYSGVSLGYQLGNVVGGGLAPVLATAIFAASGSSLLVGAYLAGMALLALVAVACTPRAGA
ncbi:MFS transporter [Amycolatopsis endophytica]|uniref:Putative proline/betaine transporter n=1 Tax=Amycolatopsis endophytica TaxID=860233 RepID=A0A853B928_9PSEU|nr:MFS transporter [Amycolatopsis endophytica]NYI91274.1 MFS family permease [Amycolatopsis endophytica]